MNRRNFIKSSTLATAASFVPFNIPAREKNLKVGLIGVGWYGMVLMKAAFKTGGIEVIGICDVDTDHLESGATEIEGLQGKKPKTYKHYQDLLDQKELEAVFIATPPHWHALQFIDACEKGLDIYCEKPLSYDVKEGLAMIDAANKAGNIVQVGFQRRQSDAFNNAGEYIISGKAGEIHQVEAQIHYDAKLKDTTIQEPPASLDWDLWCGPAPKLPYRPSIGHIAWRLEKEYGHGHLVDWGIHHIDIIRKLMNLSTPEKLTAFGGIYKFKDKITTPDTLTAHLNFQQVPIVWQHRLWGAAEYSPEISNSIKFYGEKATIVASDHQWTIIPTAEDGERKEMKIRTPDMQEKHVGEFIKAATTKDPSFISCTTEDGFQSTASVQLAMIAYETGEPVYWNNQSMEVEDQLAQQHLMRDYRAQWVHPFKS